METDSSTQNTIYVPVVFHVLYYNAGDNTSAFQIGANFDQINLDFQNLNPDGDEIPSAPNPSDAPTIQALIIVTRQSRNS